MPWQGHTPLNDGQQQFVDWADGEVEAGKLTIHDAVVLVQGKQVPTGPGAYQAPGEQEAETAELNEDSVLSQRQSAAYQKERAEQGLGYDDTSQKIFNENHPLSSFK